MKSAAGAGGSGCGAHGRRRDLAGLRADAQHHQYTRCRRCGGHRKAWLRCPWAASGPGRASSRRAAPSVHQVPPVWRAPEGPEGTGGLRGQAAVPVGGGRARAGLEIDHSEPQARVWRSRGRAAAHRHTQRPSLQTDHPAAGTPAAPRATQQQAPHQRARAYKKTDIRIGCRSVVELGGFEPPTFSLRTRRATNCAIAPRTRTA